MALVENRLGTRWFESYEALREWVASRGGWPSRTKPASQREHRLAHWVAFQRRQRAAGALTAERLRLLETIPGWKATPEEEWHATCRELRHWASAHGRFPSRSAGDAHEARLARWMDTQRSIKRTGGENGARAMPPTRQQLLEAIPGWRWSPRQETWRDSYDALHRWVGVHGRLPSTSTGDPAERDLARWAEFQRELQRRRDYNGIESMGPEHHDLLEAIPGWRWLPPRRERRGAWCASYDELSRWVTAHGRFPSPSSEERAERRLGRWAATQRGEKRRRDRDGTGSMTTERQQQLDAIPGWEWSPFRTWDESFHMLVRWVVTHGRSPSAMAADAAERRLGSWATYQRALRRRWDQNGSGPMTEDRLALLEAIPGWKWSPRSLTAGGGRSEAREPAARSVASSRRG